MNKLSNEWFNKRSRKVKLLGQRYSTAQDSNPSSMTVEPIPVIELLVLTPKCT